MDGMKEPCLFEPDYFDSPLPIEIDWLEQDWQEVIDRRNERVDEALEWHGMNGF